MKLSAQFSPCRTWRYSLTRQWLPCRSPLVWILLNPSTADESQDDPTIRRCIGFSMNAGYGGLVILNLFAFRSTWPNNLMFCPNAVGPENDAALIAQIAAGCTFVCAWGNEPFCNRHRAESLGPRAFVVRRMLRESGADVRALRLTDLQQPAHPLYLPSNLRPYPWQP